MSACLFMVNYTGKSLEFLLKEKDSLERFFANNPPRTNKFEADLYYGNLFNYSRVCFLLKMKSLEWWKKVDDERDFYCLMEREGLTLPSESQIDSIISSISYGYAQAKVECIEELKIR